MEEDRFSEGAEIDERTEKLVELVLEIARDAEKKGKDYCIGEGLGLALGRGQITRNHHDIDFHPLLEDRQYWREWFVQRGFVVEPRKGGEYPDVLKVKDERGEVVVDMWPFVISEGKTLVNRKGKLVDTGRRWSEVMEVGFRGHQVRVESPEYILEQKRKHSASTGQPYRSQDLHDLSVNSRS